MKRWVGKGHLASIQCTISIKILHTMNQFHSRQLVNYLIFDFNHSVSYLAPPFHLFLISSDIRAFSGFNCSFQNFCFWLLLWKRVKLSSVKRAIEVSLWSFTKVNGFPRHGGGQWNAKFFPSHFQQKMWKTNLSTLIQHHLALGKFYKFEMYVIATFPTQSEIKLFNFGSIAN